jgi:hypothetical protein
VAGALEEAYWSQKRAYASIDASYSGFGQDATKKHYSAGRNIIS